MKLAGVLYTRHPATINQQLEKDHLPDVITCLVAFSSARLLAAALCSGATCAALLRVAEESLSVQGAAQGEDPRLCLSPASGSFGGLLPILGFTSSISSSTLLASRLLWFVKENGMHFSGWAFTAVSGSSAQPRPQCFTALTNALVLPKAHYLWPCHSREAGRSPRQVIYNPAEHWPLLLPLSIPSAGRTSKHPSEFHHDSEIATNAWEFSVPQEFRKNSPQSSLLGPGSLRRSCWMLHTHPPQVDPNPIKGLLHMGDEEKRLSYNVGFWGLWDTHTSCSSLHMATFSQYLSRAGLGLLRVTPSHLLQKGALARPFLPCFPPLDSGDYLCHLNNAKPGPITVLQQLEDRNSLRNSLSCPHPPPQEEL